MGGVRTAPEEGGTMNTAVEVCLWLCSAAVVTGLTVLCNAGGAWMGGPAGHGSALATGGYLIFWAVFTFLSGTEGGRPLLQRILLIAGVVHLVSAAAGLLMRWGILSILALPLALPAAVVFYGLRAWMGWTELYGTAALLSLLWVCWGRARR